MPTASEANPAGQHGWIIRQIQSSARPIAQVAVLIHGWTGDEYSMEVFGRDLPDDYLRMFPRGPIQAPDGFGWALPGSPAFPSMSAFEKPCRDLIAEIDLRLAELGISRLKLRLVGFSQGAAVCHTLTALFPQRIERTAILAGFLPNIDLSFDRAQLSGKPYFLAHGQRDETIPIEMAYESVRLLRAAGVEVEFCESSAGHKLALKCMKDLQAFITA